MSLLCGVTPVLEVPFTADGVVDLDGFHAIVEYTLGCGVRSVMFPGFASEYFKLSDQERLILRDVLLAEIRQHDGVAAVIAVQDHATYLAVERAREAVDSGADWINVLPPHFLGPSPEAIHDHVCAVLDAVAPHPVVLQYAPAQTGTALEPRKIAAIAASHPNLALVKVESSPPGQLIESLAAQSPALPTVVGYAGLHMLDAARRGAVGVQPGCSFVEVYLAIWAQLERGDDTAADELYRRLLPYVSYWMQSVELIISAEKLISQRRRLIDSAHCRQPTRPLDNEEVRMVDRFLAEFSDLFSHQPSMPRRRQSLM